MITKPYNVCKHNNTQHRTAQHSTAFILLYVRERILYYTICTFILCMNIFILANLGLWILNRHMACNTQSLCWFVLCSFWQLALAGVAVKGKHTHKYKHIANRTHLCLVEMGKYIGKKLKFSHWTVIAFNADCSVCLHRMVSRFIYNVVTNKT